MVVIFLSVFFCSLHSMNEYTYMQNAIHDQLESLYKKATQEHDIAASCVLVGLKSFLDASKWQTPRYKYSKFLQKFLIKKGFGECSPDGYMNFYLFEEVHNVLQSYKTHLWIYDASKYLQRNLEHKAQSLQTELQTTNDLKKAQTFIFLQSPKSNAYAIQPLAAWNKVLLGKNYGDDLKIIKDHLPVSKK